MTFRRQVEQVKLDRVTHAIEELRAAYGEKTDELRRVIESYPEGKMHLAPEFERGLQELLRADHSEKVRGPPAPLAPKSASELSDLITRTLDRSIEEMHDLHGDIYHQVDALVKDISPYKAAEVRKIVDSALEALFDREVAVLEQSLMRVARARSLDEVSRAVTVEAGQREEFIDLLSGMRNFLGHGRDLDMGYIDEHVNIVRACGNGKRLLQLVELETL
ncbi:MAG: hypothetical protein KGH72_03790 [Candidatus Micrarchaeota archaeon]|nr:hypothetical protein [Candidatus Micrarchaeota archaeon]